MSEDNAGNEIDVEDDYDDDGEDFEDEVGAEGNRIVGARTRVVVEHIA
ncbi:MAG: hypothetical protein QOI55_1976, partial [Actinomycetota bacterium]|nr:hypothetical protein [Actinomycetota bacterium]